MMMPEINLADIPPEINSLTEQQVAEYIGMIRSNKFARTAIEMVAKARGIKLDEGLPALLLSGTISAEVAARMIVVWRENSHLGQEQVVAALRADPLTSPFVKAEQ